MQMPQSELVQNESSMASKIPTTITEEYEDGCRKRQQNHTVSEQCFSGIPQSQGDQAPTRFYGAGDFQRSFQTMLVSSNDTIMSSSHITMSNAVESSDSQDRILVCVESDPDDIGSVPGQIEIAMNESREIVELQNCARAGNQVCFVDKIRAPEPSCSDMEALCRWLDSLPLASKTEVLKKLYQTVQCTNVQTTQNSQVQQESINYSGCSLPDLR